MPGTTPTAIKVIGDPVAAGLGLSLTIPKVTNVTTHNVSVGYKASKTIQDTLGNIVSVVLSNYGAEISFEGDLEDDYKDDPPAVGDEVTLTINSLTFPTAHLSQVSVGYSATGKATVSGTITGYAKLSKSGS